MTTRPKPAWQVVAEARRRKEHWRTVRQFLGDILALASLCVIVYAFWLAGKLYEMEVLHVGQ